MTRHAGELNPEDGPGSEDLRSGPISVYPLLIRLDLDLTNTTGRCQSEIPTVTCSKITGHRKALCIS